MDRLINSKKGFDGLPTALLISFVVLIVAAAIGALIVNNVQDTLTTGTAARNVTTFGLQAFQNYGSLLPVVGIVMIAALVIGLLLSAFRGGQ